MSATVVVVGASGGTGREIVTQALRRGIEVRALVRNPDGAAFASHPRLSVMRADVLDAESITATIGPHDLVVSGLGVRSRAEVGILAAGARAIVAAAPARIVWLGAMGTGESAPAVSAPVRALLRAGFGAEYADKVAADSAVTAGGGTVVHSGPLSDKPDIPDVALEPIASMRRQFFPAGAPRATLARLMLDEAMSGTVRSGLLAVRR